MKILPPKVENSLCISRRVRGSRAFSMLELLVVMCVMITLMTAATLVLGGAKGAADITRIAYDIRGTLDLARTYAMANNTYVWVGFFEESTTGTPGTPGSGRVVMSMVASKDGTKIYSDTAVAPQTLTSSQLVQIGRIRKYEQTKLAAFTTGDINNASYTNAATTYQVGDATFSNGSTFSTSQGATAYSFSKIIQFSPQGDATKIVDSPTPLMEIGLRPTHGDTPDLASKNLVAIQVAGIGGQVRVYRP